MRGVDRRPNVVRRAVVGALASATFVSTACGAAFEWTGQMRVRSEGFDRTLRGGRVQWDALQRTRVGLAVSAASDAQIFVQAQDARVWGVERSPQADTRNVDLHQAYADVTRSFGANTVRVRVGRQELSYGDERILGAGNWTNNGRAFDAIQLRWVRGRMTADAVASRIADASEGAPPNDDLFALYHRLVNAAGDRGVEAYVLHRATPGVAFETTLGERLFGAMGRFRVDQEFAFQLGRRSRADLRAFLLATQVRARVHSAWSVGAGCDVISGDDPDDADIQHLDVSRLFQSGHRHYGILDIAEGLAGPAGLVDPYASIAGPAPRGGSARLEVHVLRVAQSDVPAVLPSVGVGEAHLGTEVDAVVSVPMVARIAAELGAAVFVPGAHLEATGRSRNAVWGYVQGTIDF